MIESKFWWIGVICHVGYRSSRIPSMVKHFYKISKICKNKNIPSSLLLRVYYPLPPFIGMNNFHFVWILTWKTLRCVKKIGTTIDKNEIMINSNIQRRIKEHFQLKFFAVIDLNLSFISKQVKWAGKVIIGDEDKANLRQTKLIRK